MYRRRRYYSRRVARKPKWLWVRSAENNASPNSTLNNLDLLSTFRTHAGISVNLPEFVVWRIRLKISITITVTTSVAANDGVLLTAFVDSYDQTAANQLSNSYDQKYLVYDMLYATETVKQSTDSLATTTVTLYKEYDIKSHRKLAALDDTLKVQLASSGTAVITGYSFQQSTLLKVG